MTEGRAAFLFVVLFIVSAILWRKFTAKYIRTHGRQSHDILSVPFLRVFTEFFWAVWLARKYKEMPPAGVIFHGVFVILMFYVLVVFIFDN